MGSVWKLALLASGLFAADLRSTYDALKQGESLSSEAAAALETRLAEKPNNVEARIQLLAHYSGQSKSPDTRRVKLERARHIQWLIEHEPKAGVFDVSTRVYAIHKSGDPLADPEAFESGRQLWLRQLVRHPRDADIKRNAAVWLELGDRETTERLLSEAGDQRWLGQLYGQALIGLVVRDYRTAEPALSDVALDDAKFAQHARTVLDRSQDPKLLGGAGWAIATFGGVLYADGKLDWDYSQIARDLLERARQLDPANLDWFSVDPRLPDRGKRPPKTLRVGGSVMQSKLLHKIDPVYPDAARTVHGTVRMNALVGVDGKIERVVVISGPNELQTVSAATVERWEYQPTLLNGKPVRIITLIDINFQ